jgi:hypothetical protein
MLLPGSHNRRTEKTEEVKREKEEKAQFFSGLSLQNFIPP